MPEQQIAQIIKSAEKLSSTRQKMEMYFQSKKNPPEKLQNQLVDLVKELDDLVLKGVSTIDEFKILFYDLVTKHSDSVIYEIENSYRHALSYGVADDGSHYRLFYLPFVYENTGSPQKEIALKPNQKEALEEYILTFLKRYNPEFDDENNSITCKAYPKIIMEWYVEDSEEGNVIHLAKAVNEQKNINLSSLFKVREQMCKNGHTGINGLSIGVIPFVLNSKEPVLLGLSDLDEDEDEFSEQFQDLLETMISNKVYCYAPIEPTMLIEEGIKHLWNVQFSKIIDEMLSVKKPTDTGVVHLHNIWKNSELIAVVIDFQLFKNTPQNNSDEARAFENSAQQFQSEMYYDKQLSRESLSMEDPGMIASFMATYPDLLRTDMRVVISNEIASLEDVFPDNDHLID